MLPSESMSRALLMAGFGVTLYGRIWVIPEGNDPNGPDLFNAAVLIQIYTEAQTAKNTLFGEIMHRTVTAADTVISGQKPGKN